MTTLLKSTEPSAYELTLEDTIIEGSLRLALHTITGRSKARRLARYLNKLAEAHDTENTNA